MKKILILIMLIPTNVYAWCSEPVAPSAPSNWSKPSKPSVPYCLNEWDNTHTCDDYTINNYNSDLERYRYELEDYQTELQNYVNEAQYFVDEVLNYANCEATNLN